MSQFKTWDCCRCEVTGSRKRSYNLTSSIQGIDTSGLFPRTEGAPIVVCKDCYLQLIEEQHIHLWGWTCKRCKAVEQSSLAMKKKGNRS
jgi:hypothetical protein